jgi:hypothetical protein
MTSRDGSAKSWWQMVNLKVDKDSMAGAKIMLAAVGRSADPIIYRAINKSMAKGQTRAVSKISRVVNLTATRIRKDFKQHKAFSGRLSGTLLAEGKPVGFMSFSGTKELKTGGVSVKIRKDRPRFRMVHAFIARGRGGKHQVFEREDWYGRPWKPGYPYAKMPKSYRLGLDRLSAIAIEDYYKDNRIYNDVQLYCSQVLEEETLRQIEFELTKI